jgi:uncharacterized protein
VASLLAMVALVAVGVPLLMYFAQDKLLFFPQPLSEQRRADIARRFAHVEDLRLDEGGQKLQAWYVRGMPDAPLVLYFGGNAEEVSWMIEEAVARTPQVSWLLVSYRGYGGSDGAPSEANISADALRWYDHATRALNARQVVVFGRSLGSGAAVYVARQRKVASVILVTPYDSLVDVARHHYPWLPVGWMLRHRFDSVSLAPRIQAPLLCIAAGADEVIPVAHAKRLYEAWGGPKRWVELQGAGHNGTDGMPAFWQSIRSVLEK